MRLQWTWSKEFASLQHSGHLIRKVYLLCQHNSWCSAAPIIPKHNLPRPRHETTLKCVMLFLVSASKLCPQSTSEAFLHICLYSNWKHLVYLAPPYHKSLSASSFRDYVLFRGTMCIELLHRQTTDAKTLRHRKIFWIGVGGMNLGCKKASWYVSTQKVRGSEACPPTTPHPPWKSAVLSPKCLQSYL